jgi:hypothetical protein
VSDVFEKSGPEVLFFIRDNQVNPHLLENLAARVMAFEKDYEGQLNQAVASTTHLRQETMRTAEGEHEGFLLTVHYYKEADPKDASVWHTQYWFLTQNEDKLFNSIWELGENADASQQDESSMKMMGYGGLPFSGQRATYNQSALQQIREALLQVSGRHPVLLNEETGLAIKPLHRNGANDFELAFRDSFISLTLNSEGLRVIVFWHNEGRDPFGDKTTGIRFTVDQNDPLATAKIVREVLNVYVEVVPGFRIDVWPDIVLYQAKSKEPLDVILKDEERPEWQRFPELP